MAALGHNLHLFTEAVEATAGSQNGTGWLNRQAGNQLLTAADPAKHAAGMVAEKLGAAICTAAHLIGVLSAGKASGLKARANFHALGCVDAHQGGGELGVDCGKAARPSRQELPALRPQ